METGHTTISLYENAVPAFVEPELDALYGHVFSSMAQFRVYNGIDGNTHTYVARGSGKTSAILLFRRDGRRVQVLNEQIAMDAAEINRFARYVFDTWPAVDVIRFPAILADGDALAFPHQQFYRTEDIVLKLPATPDDYLAALGKATRKNFKYHGNRLKRNFPALTFEVWINGKIPASHVRDIIELNRARMAAKNKGSDIDTEETERLTKLVRQSGLISAMLLDGRVVAGTICSRVGGNYFMHINSHDPAYDDARLGKLCCFMTICDCIARGGKEFHFMWGRFEYKYLLLGVQQDYDELTIYRSHVHMLLHSTAALRTACSGYSREWKFRLLDLANKPDESNPFLRAASRSLIFLSSLMHSGWRGNLLRH